MRRRLFWVAVGVGLTVVAIQQGRKYYKAMTPSGISERVSAKTSDLFARAAEFIDTFSEATAEREAELRAAVDLDQGGTRV